MRIVTCTVVGMLSLTLGCTAPPGKSTKDAAKDKAAKATTPAAPAKPVLEEHPGGVVYVAAAGSDELVMFDRVSLELIGTPIHAGHEPGSIAIAPDGRVYFPARYMNSDDIAATTPKSDDPEHPSIPDGFRSGSLWAVDSSKGNQIQSKGYIGSSDKDLDGVFVVLHPEGTWAAIADQADNNIEFRDLSDNEQKKNRTVAVGSGPFGEAFTSDGMYFLVANHDEANAVDPDTVSLINFLGDNAGPTEVAKIPVGAQPSQITVSPDNKVAYVTVTGSNKVVAINLATKAVVGEWALTGMPQGIARDALGVMYYVTLQDQNSVVKIDATTGQVNGTVQVGKEPWMVLLDEGNNRLWVTNHGESSVSVVKLSDFTLEKTLEGAKNPTGLALLGSPTVAATPPPAAQQPGQTAVTGGTTTGAASNGTVTVAPADSATASPPT